MLGPSLVSKSLSRQDPQGLCQWCRSAEGLVENYNQSQAERDGRDKEMIVSDRTEAKEMSKEGRRHGTASRSIEHVQHSSNDSPELSTFSG